MIFRLVLITTLMALLIGCSSGLAFIPIGPTEQQKSYYRDLEWVEKANPRDDFISAITRGDMRFKGIYGYTLSTPGFHRSCLDWETQIDAIEGTTDATESYEHRRLIAIAREYASTYNTLMTFHFQEIDVDPCQAN